MGKRRRHHSREGGDDVAGGESKRPRRSESPPSSSGHHHYHHEKNKQKQKQKQLYVALDDWDKGYSIHKVVGGGSLSDDDDPHPSLRLEAPRGMHDVLFGAIGSKIVALWQPRNSPTPTRAAVYDAGTGAVLAEGPAYPPGLRPMRFVAGGGSRLHALHAGGLHCLDLLDESSLEDPYNSYATAEEAEARRWRWTTPCSSSSSRLQLPFVTPDGGAPAPWGPIEIASYAVHPDGSTLFVSAFGSYHRYFGTFSLDTATPGSEWRRHGEWLLPFRGLGHYDATLDAWVGLHSPGYLCACDVPPPTTGSDERPTRREWELVRADGLFVTDPEDGVLRQSFMTLAAMGDAQFCILEPLHANELGEIPLRMPAGDEYVLRLTKFRLQRARHGRLRAPSRHVACSAYRLRKYDCNFAPQAFCI